MCNSADVYPSLYICITFIRLEQFLKTMFLNLHFYLQEYDHKLPTYQYLKIKILQRNFPNV